MVYTREKKKELNLLLRQFLPQDIICKGNKSDDLEKIWLFTKCLPENSILIESIDHLRSITNKIANSNVHGISVIFRKVYEIDHIGNITYKYLADYVLPGYETDYLELISSKRIYVWSNVEHLIFNWRIIR